LLNFVRLTEAWYFYGAFDWQLRDLAEDNSDDNGGDPDGFIFFILRLLVSTQKL